MAVHNISIDEDLIGHVIGVNNQQHGFLAAYAEKAHNVLLKLKDFELHPQQTIRGLQQNPDSNEEFGISYTQLWEFLYYANQAFNGLPSEKLEQAIFDRFFGAGTYVPKNYTDRDARTDLGKALSLVANVIHVLDVINHPSPEEAVLIQKIVQGPAVETKQGGQDLSFVGGAAKKKEAEEEREEEKSLDQTGTDLQNITKGNRVLRQEMIRMRGLVLQELSRQLGVSTQDIEKYSGDAMTSLLMSEFANLRGAELGAALHDVQHRLSIYRKVLAKMQGSAELRARLPKLQTMQVEEFVKAVEKLDIKTEKEARGEGVLSKLRGVANDLKYVAGIGDAENAQELRKFTSGDLRQTLKNILQSEDIDFSDRQLSYIFDRLDSYALVGKDLLTMSDTQLEGILLTMFTVAFDNNANKAKRVIEKLKKAHIDFSQLVDAYITQTRIERKIPVLGNISETSVSGIQRLVQINGISVVQAALYLPKTTLESGRIDGLSGKQQVEAHSLRNELVKHFNEQIRSMSPQEQRLWAGGLDPTGSFQSYFSSANVDIADFSVFFNQAFVTFPDWITGVAAGVPGGNFNIRMAMMSSAGQYGGGVITNSRLQQFGQLLPQLDRFHIRKLIDNPELLQNLLTSPFGKFLLNLLLAILPTILAALAALLAAAFLVSLAQQIGKLFGQSTAAAVNKLGDVAKGAPTAPEVQHGLLAPAAAKGVTQPAATTGVSILGTTISQGALAAGSAVGITAVATIMISNITMGSFLVNVGPGEITSPGSKYIDVSKSVEIPKVGSFVLDQKTGNIPNAYIKALLADGDKSNDFLIYTVTIEANGTQGKTLSTVNITDTMSGARKGANYATNQETVDITPTYVQADGQPFIKNGEAFQVTSIVPGQPYVIKYKVPILAEYQDAYLTNVVDVTAVVDGSTEKRTESLTLTIGDPPVSPLYLYARHLAELIDQYNPAPADNVTSDDFKNAISDGLRSSGISPDVISILAGSAQSYTYLQCVAFVNAVAVGATGSYAGSGDARNFNRSVSGFAFMDKSAKPIPGDIAVFEPGNNVGTAGHVGVIGNVASRPGGLSYTFTLIDANENFKGGITGGTAFASHTFSSDMPEFAGFLRAIK